MLYRRITLFICVGLLSCLTLVAKDVRPIRMLLERIDSGMSDKLGVEVVGGDMDFFEVTQRQGRPHIRANNAVSAAVGLNRYLRDVAGVHLSWNSMSREMPERLPEVATPLSGSTPMPLRYYLNYCTHSYSMAFWDWHRWEREIDWMALHGINMPLVITGSAALWRNVLLRLGYDDEEISRFVAGPGFQAWWLMNNLEGWGGPDSKAFYERDRQLAGQIVGRMKELGIEPVVPGYSGMVPHDAGAKLGLDVKDPGLWCGFSRPAFLQPEDKDFDRIARIYYDEARKMYGDVKYFSMDPFHEGGNTEGVDMRRAGRKIFDAMKRSNPEAGWVIQSWQENPRREMIDSLPEGQLVILDLQSENVAGWLERPGGYLGHDWLFCMLHNFGGNVGLYGKMQALVDNFYDRAVGEKRLRGVGLTMEGIENNPVMYELLCDMPWHKQKIDLEKWVSDYAASRYGTRNEMADSAWRLLARTVYNCPADSVQQGTHESVFCARPSDNPRQVSTWSSPKDYYDGMDVIRAARLLAAASPELGHSENYRYDLVDVTRQAVAEKGRMVSRRLGDAAVSSDRQAYAEAADDFLRLIMLQDSLLATIPDFRLGRWLEMARACGSSEQEKDLYEWNARVQITTWGPRAAADGGGLHDYAHREWQGLLRDFYMPRWKAWFDARLASWDSGYLPDMDFYSMEESWTRNRNTYSAKAEGDPVATAIAALRHIDNSTIDRGVEL